MIFFSIPTSVGLYKNFIIIFKEKLTIMALLLYILSIVLAIAATVLVLIFITPEKNREKLPKFFVIVADIFNFKHLLIENILKVLYIFSTLFSILYGFFNIFSFVPGGFTVNPYTGAVSETLVWTGWKGFLILIFAPIAIRLAYEGIMMFILLVKNTIDINKKLKNQNVEKKDEE